MHVLANSLNQGLVRKCDVHHTWPGLDLKTTSSNDSTVARYAYASHRYLIRLISVTPDASLANCIALLPLGLPNYKVSMAFWWVLPQLTGVHRPHIVC